MQLKRLHLLSQTVQWCAGLPCLLLSALLLCLAGQNTALAADSVHCAPILDPPGASDDLRLRTDVALGAGRSDDPAEINPAIQDGLSAVIYYRFIFGLHARDIGLNFRYDGNNKHSQVPDSALVSHSSTSHSWDLYLTYRMQMTKWLVGYPLLGYNEGLDYVEGMKDDGTYTYNRERRGSGPIIGLEGILRVARNGRIRVTYYQAIHSLRDHRLSLEYLVTRADSERPHPHIGYVVLGCQLGQKDSDRLEVVGYIGLGLVGTVLP